MPEYRGSGGAIFEITVPEPGTQARKDFDRLVEKGALTLVEPPPAETKPRERAPRKE